MEAKDTVIVGLVILLVLAVVFSINNQLTGKVTHYPCSETDDGYDIFNKGTITGSDYTGSYTKTDFCSADGTKVIEYRCNVGQGAPGWQRIAVDCTLNVNGENICSDGACLP